MKFSTYREPFTHKGYGAFYAAYSISKLGDWVYLVGFSLWLFELTGSAPLMALVTALQTVPRVLLGAVTGAIADRVDRAKLMGLCDLLQAFLVLPLLMVHTRQQLPIVYVVAFLLSLLSAQSAAARGPLVAAILPSETVVKGNALINATESVIMLLGPAVGAWAVAKVGFQLTFVLNSASFVLSALFLFVLARMPLRRSDEPEDHASFGSSVSGFFQAIRTPGILRQLLLVMGLLALGQGVVQALHTPLMIQFIRLSQQQYAAVLALQGVGGLLGSYLIIPLSERYSPKVLLGAGLLCASVTNGLLVTYPNFWVVSALTIVEGVFFTGVFVSIPTLIQQWTPDNMMGRAFAALDATENGFMLLSMTVSGLLVAVASMRTLFLAVSSLFVAGGLVAFRTLHTAASTTSTSASEAAATLSE